VAAAVGVTARRLRSGLSRWSFRGRGGPKLQLGLKRVRRLRVQL
jgi:hypothetical protein